MAGKPVLTLEQLSEKRRVSSPATADDVTVTLDGRRIDSREAALGWLVEVDAVRAAERAANIDA
jgi:hypothetical protein